MYKNFLRYRARTTLVFCFVLILILIAAVVVLILHNREPGRKGTVYIAGDYNGRPYYWKDGHPFQLSDYPGRAMGVTISGARVYISGYIIRSSGAEACYWVDGVLKDLELGENFRNSYANAIAVHKNTVYAAGYFNDGIIETACFWKDGKKEKGETELPIGSGETNIRANGIGIVDGKAYISGYYRRNGRSAAFRWKDGDEIKTLLPTLDSGPEGSAAFTLDALKNSVYVAGYYFDGDDETACYWENGVKMNLPPAPDETSSFSYGITAQGSGVYVTGEYYSDAGFFRAFYWKTGDASKTALSSSISRGIDIASIGSSIYVCGFEEDAYGKFPPCYWKITEESGVRKIEKIPLADSDIPGAALAITAAAK